MKLSQNVCHREILEELKLGHVGQKVGYKIKSLGKTFLLSKGVKVLLAHLSRRQLLMTDDGHWLMAVAHPEAMAQVS